MELKKATRKKVKIKVGLQGSSGSGKTLSALLLAYGVTGDWSKIAFIDTENESASLYVNREFDNPKITIGEFLSLDLKAPYTPERCSEAINTCVKAGVEFIIFDSISHEWMGKGGVLDIHEQMGKMNDMQKWAKLTPRHNRFIDDILQCPVHMALCMRSKQDYIMKEGVNSSGRNVIMPEKVGLKAVTKDGVDYEFTVNFDLDTNNFATSTKDRTALFKGKPEFKISPDTGKMIKDWCELGIDVIPEPKPKQVLSEKAFLQAIERINQGESGVLDKILELCDATEKQLESLKTAEHDRLHKSTNGATGEAAK